MGKQDVARFLAVPDKKTKLLKTAKILKKNRKKMGKIQKMKKKS